MQTIKVLEQRGKSFTRPCVATWAESLDALILTG